MKLGFKMIVQMPFGLKPLVAACNRACVRFFPSMRSHMGFKVATFTEPRSTHLTLERLLACMTTHVDFESMSAFKFPFAIGPMAMERTLTSMTTFVINKMTLGNKSLATALKVALIGTLFRMNA